MRLWKGSVGGAFALIVAMMVTACGSGGQPQASTGKTVVTLAYSSNYVLDTTPLTTEYYNSIAKQFDAKYPHATVKLVPIAGSYTDIVDKLSLLYRSKSTAPDVAEMPTEQIGGWASAGYLLPLNKYLPTSAWWSTFPSAVQGEGTFGGKVYAVNQGENDEFMYYDKTIFQRAGLPVPWQPKTWQDIITAAQAIKAHVPGVSPLWVYSGNASGASGVLQGSGNLLYGTTTPQIQDPQTGKWVVDSPGIRVVLGFYHAVDSLGLGAPVSDLFSPSGIGDPTTMFAKGQLGIAIGSNYYGGGWTKTVSAPYFPAAPSVIGVAPVPTENGQAPGSATTIGGWDLALAASSPHPSYSWDLLNLMENAQNEVTVGNYAGFVPPSSQYGKDPAFVNFAPPFNAMSVQVLPDGRSIPSSSNFAVWAYGFNEATGDMALHPGMSVQAALNVFKGYVTNQLGASSVETIGG